jgi:hypothetical protein
LLKLEAKVPAIVAFEMENVGSNRGLSMLVRGNDLDTFADKAEMAMTPIPALRLFGRPVVPARFESTGGPP